MKNIGILGSTGSIGTQTLEVVREQKDINVIALSAGKNIQLLEEQIREFKPKMVAVSSQEDAKVLRAKVSDLNVLVVSGMEGLIQVSTQEEIEILVTAIVGMLGIRPTIEAIKAGKHIALANKETLVTAGHLIMPLAKENHVLVLPVDSEHSAIFQCLQGESNKVRKLILTASGGPFRGKTKEELQKVTKEEALNHPNWSMGAKITIDSSTLVNKGLEVMEAKWLFGVELDQIEVVVHPQSVIHSGVEFEDGALIAQLGTPDMRLPISYALSYPKRRPLSGERLNLLKFNQLTFEEPDVDTFLGLNLAYRAMRIGGNLPTVYNAANEKAVELFLSDQITYSEITKIIQMAMDAAVLIEDPSLEEILWTEEKTYQFIESRC